MGLPETSRGSARNAISSLSTAGLNPYLELFYAALATAGVPTGPPARLRLRWLLARRREVRYLHAHWPEPLYRFERGPASLRPALSWGKLAVLRARLWASRALGYRLVWTIHQVYPHGSAERLDRAGARLLVRSADLLVAHDPETAERARIELAPRRSVEVVTHGSYVGVYPAGRPRDEVRRELHISPDAVVFLSFGELRANSDWSLLLDAFRGLRAEPTVLIVAGNAKDARAGAAIAAAAQADRRILWLDGFVPLGRVRELYEAADAAVVTRGDGGTSGSLILALSLGRPVVVADRPANRRLLADGAAGWLFEPGHADDLLRTFEAAVHDEPGRLARGSAAREIAATLDWDEAARRFASLLRR